MAVQAVGGVVRPAQQASIIIDNYNYRRYLREAIDSALAQSYAPIEVIVVDDGSTDGSPEILCVYGERIQPVLKPNGGQASALNAGLAHSRGEVVFFLDADDVLRPQAVERVMQAFQHEPQAVRAHYRMEVIDSQGKRTGEVKPPWWMDLPQGDLRRQAAQFPFDLPWLPTSGNAFKRQALERIFPIPEAEYRILADYYLSNLTPLFGPLAAIDEILAGYRVHGENAYAWGEEELDLERLRKSIRQTPSPRKYHRHFSMQLGLGNMSTAADSDHSVSTVANRLISLRLEPGRHPIPDDRRAALLLRGLASAWRRFDLKPGRRLLFWLWFVMMTITPVRLARRLAEAYWFPARRTRLFRAKTGYEDNWFPRNDRPRQD